MKPGGALVRMCRTGSSPQGNFHKAVTEGECRRPSKSFVSVRFLGGEPASLESQCTYTDERKEWSQTKEQIETEMKSQTESAL